MSSQVDLLCLEGGRKEEKSLEVEDGGGRGTETGPKRHGGRKTSIRRSRLFSAYISVYIYIYVYRGYHSR